MKKAVLGGIGLIWALVGTGCGGRVDAEVGGPEPAPPAKLTAAWPMRGRDAAHTSRAASPVTPTVPYRSWQLSLGEVLRSSPVIAADGTIYAATAHALHAVSASGVEKWSAPIAYPDAEPPAPAVTPDGLVLVRDAQRLDAFGSDGALAWTLEIAHGALSSATVAPNGTLYAAEASGPLLEISADGVLLGTLGPGGSDGRYSAPALRKDGTLTFVQVDTFGSEAWAFAADGTPRFDVHGIGPIYGYQTCPVAGETATYIAADGGIVALGVSGDVSWSVVGDSNNESPALGSDGTLYAPLGGKVTAIDPGGATLWSAVLGDWVRAVSLAGDGSIYAAVGDHLDVLDDRGELVNSINVGSPITSEIVIDRDGTAVFGTESGVLEASSAGLTP
jgi:PQQ-like domain